MSRYRPRLTYANVMSTLAVFGVLGGGAFAAVKIGPEDIEKNAVRSKHIKAGAVKARHLAPGLLARVRSGAPGVPGPQGESATRLFAFVESKATLFHGVGVTGATRSSAGRYRVTFNRSLQGCVANANYYRENLASGDNLANHFGISRVGTDANALDVDIYNTDLVEMVDRSFALAVFCP